MSNALKRRKIAVLGSRSVGEYHGPFSHFTAAKIGLPFLRQIFPCEAIHWGLLPLFSSSCCQIHRRWYLFLPLFLDLEQLHWLILSNHRIHICKECGIQGCWIWLSYHRHRRPGQCLASVTHCFFLKRTLSFPALDLSSAGHFKYPHQFSSTTTERRMNTRLSTLNTP